jgi:hypothetical protein
VLWLTWGCLQVKVKAVHNKEPELISWDEVEQQKDVYQAITTSDGRQALVKASSGEHTICTKLCRPCMSTEVMIT